MSHVENAFATTLAPMGGSAMLAAVRGPVFSMIP